MVTHYLQKGQQQNSTFIPPPTRVNIISGQIPSAQGIPQNTGVANNPVVTHIPVTHNPPPVHSLHNIAPTSLPQNSVTPQPPPHSVTNNSVTNNPYTMQNKNIPQQNANVAHINANIAHNIANTTPYIAPPTIPPTTVITPNIPPTIPPTKAAAPLPARNIPPTRSNIIGNIYTLLIINSLAQPKVNVPPAVPTMPVGVTHNQQPSVHALPVTNNPPPSRTAVVKNQVHIQNYFSANFHKPTAVTTKPIVTNKPTLPPHNPPPMSLPQNSIIPRKSTILITFSLFQEATSSFDDDDDAMYDAAMLQAESKQEIPAKIPAKIPEKNPEKLSEVEFQAKVMKAQLITVNSHILMFFSLFRRFRFKHKWTLH
jgi:hypothetical protein